MILRSAPARREIARTARRRLVGGYSGRQSPGGPRRAGVRRPPGDV